MQIDALATALEGVDGPTIVCAQAGEVNTGSFDAVGRDCLVDRFGRRLAARRRSVRDLGGSVAGLTGARRRGRARQLMGIRCP